MVVFETEVEGGCGRSDLSLVLVVLGGGYKPCCGPEGTEYVLRLPPTQSDEFLCKVCRLRCLTLLAFPRDGGGVGSWGVRHAYDAAGDGGSSEERGKDNEKREEGEPGRAAQMLR